MVFAILHYSFCLTQKNHHHTLNKHQWLLANWCLVKVWCDSIHCANSLPHKYLKMYVFFFFYTNSKRLIWVNWTMCLSLYVTDSSFVHLASKHYLYPAALEPTPHRPVKHESYKRKKNQGQVLSWQRCGFSCGFTQAWWRWDAGSTWKWEVVLCFRECVRQFTTLTSLKCQSQRSSKSRQAEIFNLWVCHEHFPFDCFFFFTLFQLFVHSFEES